MRQHNINGLAIAKFLEGHPKVEKVLHPGKTTWTCSVFRQNYYGKVFLGLPSHSQHEIFKSQTSGHSGMVAVYIKGGLEESNRFLKELKVFTLAESLGGYESLAELP